MCVSVAEMISARSPLEVWRQLLSQEQVLGGQIRARLQRQPRESSEISENPQDCPNAEATPRRAHASAYAISREPPSGPRLGSPDSANIAQDSARATHFADHNRHHGPHRLGIATGPRCSM